MYTIGEISEMSGLPTSTLRYYDKQGLFPNMKRESGIRKFDDEEIEALRFIECLKKSGLEIKDIKQFMGWCAEGSSTYAQRHNLFLRQKERIECELKEMQKVLELLTFKCWYYETLMEGKISEEELKAGVPENLPKEIKRAYKRAYS